MTYLEGPRAAQKALRQAQLYGYLIAKHGRLYHPGGNRALCSVQLSKNIVRSGCLRFRSGKYELTPEGFRVLANESIGLDLVTRSRLSIRPRNGAGPREPNKAMSAEQIAGDATLRA